MQRESSKDRHAHESAQRARRGLRPWILFGIASLFYFYEFFARVAPGVLQAELTQASGAGGGAYGMAMSMYFLAYAPAQLLVGRLLARHGVRT